MSRGGDGGLSGAALSALGGRPLRGFAASLPAGSALSSFGERLRRGFFGSPAAGCSVSPGASFAGASPAFSTSARAAFRFSPMSSLICSKDTTTSPGSGFAGPPCSCWGVGAAACSGAGAWGWPAVTDSGASGIFSHRGPCSVCHLPFINLLFVKFAQISGLNFCNYFLPPSHLSTQKSRPVLMAGRSFSVM